MIFNLPFKYVLPVALEGHVVIPKVEVTYVNLQNEDNEHIAIRDKVVSATAKTTRSVLYANVTTDEAQQLINDNEGVLEGFKKKIRLFKDPNNRAAHDTITQELDEDGHIQSTFVSKYGYAQEILPEELPEINSTNMMLRNFGAVITNYLSNGTI